MFVGMFVSAWRVFLSLAELCGVPDPLSPCCSELQVLLPGGFGDSCLFGDLQALCEQGDAGGRGAQVWLQGGVGTAQGSQ